MPNYKERNVLELLNQLGFEKESGKRNKHRFYALYHEGKKAGVNVHFSKNKQDINDYLISRLADEMQITRQQFIQLMQGDLSKEDYLKILKDKQII